MGKTYKDNRVIKEFVKPIKGKKVALSYEEQLELDRIKEDLHWERMMRIGLSG